MYFVIQLCFYVHVLLLFNNSLNMVKIDRNKSELWQIVFKNII